MSKFIDFSDSINISDDEISPSSTSKQKNNSFINMEYLEAKTLNKPICISKQDLSLKSLEIHEHIRKKLDGFYQSNKIPHIIFHGASGTGKLTIVYDFIKKIYGNDKSKIKSNVMIVNCSHGKGIKFIREELKFFAKTNIQINSGVFFKTILLLNAHHLTIDAQSALRRCIELFSYNTRFFIIVENKNKLLNPILSRFCEIYVPEIVDNGQIINLHQVSHVELELLVSANKMETIERMIGTILETKSIMEIMDVANELYECGISCLDLMKWMETGKDKWKNIDYYAINLKFYSMKSEFRCEKLLLFYILLEIYSLNQPI